MRIYWSEDEIIYLKYLYVEMGLSISELFNDYILKYPNRTKTAIKVKIKKLKLKHTKEQTSNIKSRLYSGSGNGMYGKESWSKGKTKFDCDILMESSKKISLIKKEMYKKGLLDISGKKNGMYGKEPWSKGKTKYNDARLMESAIKLSKIRSNIWKSLSNEEKDKRIGDLSLASNKAKKDTKIEIIIKEKLVDLNIKFVKNYRCNRFIFDFYLIDYNFVIECQGDYWHGNPNIFLNLNEIQLKNRERDKKKEKYLSDNNIKSLFLWENEIYKYRENIGKIIIDKINEKY